MLTMATGRPRLVDFFIWTSVAPIRLRAPAARSISVSFSMTSPTSGSRFVYVRRVMLFLTTRRPWLLLSGRLVVRSRHFVLTERWNLHLAGWVYTSSLEA